MRKGSVNPLAATLPQFLFLKGGECFFSLLMIRGQEPQVQKIQKIFQKYRRCRKAPDKSAKSNRPSY